MPTTARVAVVLCDGHPSLPARASALGEGLTVLPMQVASAGLQGLVYVDKAG